MPGLSISGRCDTLGGKASPMRLAIFRCRADWGVLLALGVYLSSFAIPAFSAFSDSPMYGWVAFVALGEIVLIDPGRGVAPSEYALLLFMWMANPMFCGGVLMSAMGRWRCAAALSLGALAGGLTCPFDPTGPSYNVAQFRVGYFVWVSSM